MAGIEQDLSNLTGNDSSIEQLTKTINKLNSSGIGNLGYSSNEKSIQGGALNPNNSNSDTLPVTPNFSTFNNSTNNGYSTDITHEPVHNSQWDPGSIDWNNISKLGNKADISQSNNSATGLDQPIDYTKLLIYGGIGGLLGGGPIPYVGKVIDKKLSQLGDNSKIGKLYTDGKSTFENFTHSKSRPEPQTQTRTDGSLDTKGDVLDDFKQYSSRFAAGLKDGKVANVEDSFFSFKHYFNNDFGSKLDDWLNSPQLVKPNDFISNHSDIFGVSSVPELAGEFIKGAAIAGLAISANDYLDRLLTHKNQHDANWLFNGLFLPIAMSAPNMSSLVTWGLVGSVSSIGLEHILPQGSEVPQYSRFFKPTVCSSLLVGAAMMLPAESVGVRLSYITGAWLLGNMNHYVFDR